MWRRVWPDRELKQLEYEASRAFEQYDAVDARNRLAASQLNVAGTRSWKRSRKPNTGYLNS